MVYTITAPLEPLRETLETGETVNTVEARGIRYPVETYVVIGESVIFTLGSPIDA